MVFKHIIFDWSCTLQDDLKIFYQVTNCINKNLGSQKEITLAEIQDHFTIPYMDFWNRYHPTATSQEVSKCYVDVMKKIPQAGLVTGMLEVLEKLNKSVKLYILSSDPQEKINQEINPSGLKGFFKRVVVDCHNKQEGLKELLISEKINPQEAIYIGDTSGDIIAAHKNSLKAGAVAWGIQHDKLIKKVNPEYFFEKPKEILRLIRF